MSSNRAGRYLRRKERRQFVLQQRQYLKRQQELKQQIQQHEQLQEKAQEMDLPIEMVQMLEDHANEELPQTREQQEQHTLQVSSQEQKEEGKEGVTGAAGAGAAAASIQSAAETTIDFGTAHNPISIKDVLHKAPEGQSVAVKGQIVSASGIKDMKFRPPGSKLTTAKGRAITVELMDVESYNDIDALKVILRNELAENVKIGENCVVSGILAVEHEGKKAISSETQNVILGLPVLLANDVRYLKAEESQANDELSQHQIDRVHKFVKFATEEYGDDNTVIDRLVSIYSGKQIIKNENVKEALLYAMASVTANLKDGTDMNKDRKRLNVGLIGFPGGGKTFLAKSVLRYNHRNRFESAQSSSSKSLTAIISREGGRILRVGSIPKSKQAICVIDEIGEIPNQEQSLLQGIMEEGNFTLNKYGFNANIRADTVIVWTTNPKNATNSNARLSFKDLPIRKQILDRTDLLIVQKPIVDPEEREEFNRLKLDYDRATPERKKILAYYDDYTRLHFLVMKRKYSNQDITITEEAAKIINAADIEISKRKAEGAGSFRTIVGLTRLTEAVAKLKLKDKADASDATRAVEFYNKVTTVNMVDSNSEENGDGNDAIDLFDTEAEKKKKDPATITKDVIIDQILKPNPSTAYTITELAQKAVNLNETVKVYLGSEIGDVSSNMKLRRVRDLLLEETKTVGSKPVRLMYSQ